MAAEYLEIDAWVSETPAWTCLDYTPLKEAANQRGGDLLIPGAAGVVPYQRRITVTEKSLPFHIYGTHDSDGEPYADGFDGLQANIDEINDSIVEPTGIGDGTREALWHLPDGSTRGAFVHVLELKLSRVAPIHARAILKISIPVGRFLAAVS
jgi:hypothetical protein